MMMYPPRLSGAALLIAAIAPFTGCAQSTPAAEAAPEARPAAPTTPAPEAAETPAPATPAAEAKESPAEAAKPEVDTAAREARRAINRATLEKLRIDTELEIRALKRRAELQAESDERARLDAEAGLRAAKLAAENAATEETRAESDRRLGLAEAKARLAQIDATERARTIELESRILKQELENTVARLGAEAFRVRREQEADKVLVRKNLPDASPLKDGILHISDRRILINGVIADATARDFIDRVNFYNLRDPKAPVFVIIDNSPGGSLMAIEQILRAMQSSAAPVHVVLKGHVGGGASTILTLAPHSYAFERATITYHQSNLRGNEARTAVARDTLRLIDNWFARIYTPVAAKMGVSLDEFQRLMYENNARGDWTEFADVAAKHKWVQTLVKGLDDRSVDTLVETPSGSPISFSAGEPLEQLRDRDGSVYYALPPLSYGDSWMIHSPEGIFRTR